MRREYRRVAIYKENVKQATPPAENDLDALLLEELQKLARSRPQSGRGAAAKAAALRILERRKREQELPREELPEGVGLDDPVPEGFWHPNPGTPWEELDAHQTVRQRLRWKARLEGREPRF
jgi:hypothetical protein